MGTKLDQIDALSCNLPRGVSIRRNACSASIQIYFSFKGQDCRETLKHLPCNKSGIRYAERLRGEVLNAIARGTFQYGEYFPNSKRARRFGYGASNVTVGELFNEHLKIWEQSLQPSTVRGYRIAINAHLTREFGKIRVRELTPAMLRTWIVGLTVTAKRVRNILTPLKTILETALNDGIIESNPLDKIAVGKLLDKATRESEFEVDPFGPDEVKKILEAAAPQARNLFQFAFATGLRTSELIGLEWSDIDWNRRLAHVSRAVVEKAVKGTKTKAGLRDVYLSSAALEALEKQKQFTLLQHGRIFHNPRTKKPWESDGQIRKSCWKGVLEAAGVRYRNPYQTRHTFASALLSSGENPLWVAHQMGHRTTEMITRHYGRWLPDYSDKRRAVAEPVPQSTGNDQAAEAF